MASVEIEQETCSTTTPWSPFLLEVSATEWGLVLTKGRGMWAEFMTSYSMKPDLYFECLSFCLLFGPRVMVRFACLYLNTSSVSRRGQYHSV